MPLIKVENASFSYGDTEIFSNINFQIDKGQVLCLLGPNGCGKTTLMDCILGFYDLDRGNIFLEKVNIDKMDPRQIARALAQKTPVIILDEPTAHLDFEHELRIMETVVNLVQENQLTIIMATHFPNHAFYFQNNSLKTSILMMNNRQYQ